MAQPLEQLLRKNVPFKWKLEQQQAFDDIKRAFDEAPNLFLMRPDMKFGLYVDASRTGLGAKLY